MNIEEAKKKLLEPKKIPLVEIIRKFKREGIENFIITRPEIVEALLTAYEKEIEKNKELEDKIKAKIEEIDEVLKGQLIEKIRVYFEAQKEVLQLLLEKEK